MKVLFNPRLCELIFPDTTRAAVPSEITDQAEPGEETITVARWATKTGLIRRGDVLDITLPASLAA